MPGRAGRNGLDGKTGPQGKKGGNGKDGISIVGTTGPRGVKGERGEQGPPGKGGADMGMSEDVVKNMIAKATDTLKSELKSSIAALERKTAALESNNKTMNILKHELRSSEDKIVVLERKSAMAIIMFQQLKKILLKSI